MAAQAPIALTNLSEAQRTQALERFALLRPALEGQISQTRLAREQHLALSTLQRWIKQYREKGLAGLANARRSDKGKSRRIPAEAITLIEGLALQKPPRSMAAIHRQVTTIAQQQGWTAPSYDRVRQIIKGLGWSHRVSPHSEDFTDQEAVAAILRITQGNLRLIDRLMKQVERVLTANQLTVVSHPKSWRRRARISSLDSNEPSQKPSFPATNSRDTIHSRLATHAPPTNCLPTWERDH